MVPSHGSEAVMPDHHNHHEAFHQMSVVQDSRNIFLLSSIDALPNRHVHRNYHNHGFEQSVRVQETEKRHGESNENPQISGFQQYLNNQFYPQERVQDSRNKILLPVAHVFPDRHVHQNHYHRQFLQLQQPYHYHQEAFHQQQRIQDTGNRFLPSHDRVVMPNRHVHRNYNNHGFEQSVRVQETEKRHGESNENPQISGFQQYLNNQFYPQERVQDSRNKILLPVAHVLPDRHVHQIYYHRQFLQLQKPYHYHQEAFHQQQRIQDTGNRFLPSHDTVVLPSLHNHQYLQTDSCHDQHMAQSYYDQSFEQSVRKLMEFDAVMLPKLKKIVTSANSQKEFVQETEKKHDHVREEAQNLNKVVMSTTDSQKELVQETEKKHDHVREEAQNLNKVVMSTTGSQTKNHHHHHHHHHVLIKKQKVYIDIEEAYYQKAEKTKGSLKWRCVRSAAKKKH